MNLYEINPIICRANTAQAIEIRPLYDHVMFEDRDYEVICIAMETHERENLTVRAIWGTLKFSLRFGAEQEYAIFADNSRFSVYCLGSDIYDKNPYKGDFHIHSNKSDGLEDPAFVAVSARRIGMDFIAITDHRRYWPSLEAIERLKGFKSDFLVLPGEEIHPPDNPVHMVNFGGTCSINEMFDDRYRAYLESASRCHQLGIEAAKIYASCEWCFQNIEKSGGISILCHPYWITDEKCYNIEAGLLDYFIEMCPFTALELLGGHETESNVLQVAYYNQKRAEGKKIPIVSVSDAHSTIGGDYFGWTYTVVLADELSLESIKEGLENGLSVAVENLPGEAIRMYGDFRLVKYAMFLNRAYFPVHDEDCESEARKMFAHLREMTTGLVDVYWNQ